MAGGVFVLGDPVSPAGGEAELAPGDAPVEEGFAARGVDTPPGGDAPTFPPGAVAAVPAAVLLASTAGATGESAAGAGTSLAATAAPAEKAGATPSCAVPRLAGPPSTRVPQADNSNTEASSAITVADI